MSTLTSSDVKQLSQILHSTSKALGLPSKLSGHRELLSQLLGFRDWNAARAMLPDLTTHTTHVAIASVQVPQSPPKFLMLTGNDALWQMPGKVHDQLISRCLNPKDLRVSSWSRPDPIDKGEKARYWAYSFSPRPGHTELHKVPMAPDQPDYGDHDLTPVVMTLANAQMRDVASIALWSITLHSGSRNATAFSEVASLPIYNTLVHAITGRSPGIREAYCLVNSRRGGFSSAIVRCDEMGRELDIAEHLPYMADDAAWKILAPYNNALGLSLLDVADITKACVGEDNAYSGGL